MLTTELLLAKSLPNRSHHKGCVWAHESRADFKDRCDSQCMSAPGLDRESGQNFSLFSFSKNFGHSCFLSTKIRESLFNGGLPTKLSGVSIYRNPEPYRDYPIIAIRIRFDFQGGDKILSYSFLLNLKIRSYLIGYSF